MNAKGITVVKTFDQNRPMWRNDKLQNEQLVKMILKYCYEKFRARNYLFLNEVYQDLGMPLTQQGQVAGWVFNTETELADNVMWTVRTKHNDCNVYITFEPLDNILDVLPKE